MTKVLDQVSHESAAVRAARLAAKEASTAAAGEEAVEFGRDDGAGNVIIRLPIGTKPGDLVSLRTSLAEGGVARARVPPGFKARFLHVPISALLPAAGEGEAEGEEGEAVDAGEAEAAEAEQAEAEVVDVDEAEAVAAEEVAAAAVAAEAVAAEEVAAGEVAAEEVAAAEKGRGESLLLLGLAASAPGQAPEGLPAPQEQPASGAEAAAEAEAVDLDAAAAAAAEGEANAAAAAGARGRAAQFKADRAAALLAVERRESGRTRRKSEKARESEANAEIEAMALALVPSRDRAGRSGGEGNDGDDSDYNDVHGGRGENAEMAAMRATYADNTAEASETSVVVDEESGKVIAAGGYKLHLSETSSTGYTRVKEKTRAGGKPRYEVYARRDVFLGTFDTAVEAAIVYARWAADQKTEQQQEEELRSVLTEREKAKTALAVRTAPARLDTLLINAMGDRTELWIQPPETTLAGGHFRARIGWYELTVQVKFDWNGGPICIARPDAAGSAGSASTSAGAHAGEETRGKASSALVDVVPASALFPSGSEAERRLEVTMPGSGGGAQPRLLPVAAGAPSDLSTSHVLAVPEDALAGERFTCRELEGETAESDEFEIELPLEAEEGQELIARTAGGVAVSFVVPPGMISRTLRVLIERSD